MPYITVGKENASNIELPLLQRRRRGLEWCAERTLQLQAQA